MLDRTLIGRESKPVVHEVEKGAIRRFAEALGDPNPLYQDEGPPARPATPGGRAADLSGDAHRQRALPPLARLGTRSCCTASRLRVRPAASWRATGSRWCRGWPTSRSAPAASGPTDVLVIEDEGRDDRRAGVPLARDAHPASVRGR